MVKLLYCTAFLAILLATSLFHLPRPAEASNSAVREIDGASKSQSGSGENALQGVKLTWLDGAPPAVPQGVSWGVPWPRGTVKRDAAFGLVDSTGAQVPLQTWPLAYWPDGSLKWSGHAIAATAKLTGPLTLASGKTAAPPTPLEVKQTDKSIRISSGETSWTVPTSGPILVEAITMGKRVVAQDGRLVCTLEDRSEYKTKRTIREEDFVSQVTSAIVEQSGPVRAVVKFEGKHKSLSSDRAWLPFVVRLYFFAGVDSVKMVHSIVFDGDEKKDFIRGLGVRFDVPMRQEAHNRHVRLAGESGLMAEPVRLIAGRRMPSQDLYAKQIAGKPIPKLDQLPLKQNVKMMAEWDGFKLVQNSPESFSIQKRTGDHSTWINAAAGKRSLGLAFVGDTTGGLAVGMRNFWQLCPTALEVDKATTAKAEVTTWLWSPDAPAMDMRHYDIKEHGLEASYEDIQPGFSSPLGVARTTELTLRPCAQTPANAELWELAKANSQPSRLVCSPQYYHSIPIFGIWSLPDRSTASKRWIEDQLDQAISFYQGQIEQRRWYGFWDFGDVMHSYDPQRHSWRYDVGGFAWANTELMPDIWLWYSFLRTGRADIFRMAEAMSRQTQEVDVAHLGKFAGFGSRHNVRHWGDGAKEVRVSQALLKRFYYYLTTDERIGDLMDEVVDVDARLVDIDPLRMIEPKSKYPTHIRVGPDWFAVASNWMTKWERTGDTKYRDKILTGMKCMAAMPHKLFSGPSYGYDPKTSMIYHLHNKVDVPHLANLMGGPEFCFEVRTVIDLPEWNEAWLHYCELLTAPQDQQKKALGAAVNSSRGSHYARMAAFAAYIKNDPKLAQRAWQDFFGASGKPGRPQFSARRVEGPDFPVPVDEVPGASTNNTAQWCLNAIELLEMVGKNLQD
jgi:hypothetical protein